MTPEEQITVSRDVLRLELSNLELRLTGTLATRVEVQAIAERQEAWDRGDLSTGMLLAIKAMILQEISNMRSGKWSLRANRGQWVSAIVAGAALVIALVGNFHHHF